MKLHFHVLFILLSDFHDHPAPLKPLVAVVSSRAVSHVSSSQQQTHIQPPATLPKPFAHQPPLSPPKPSSDPQPQPSSTYPKPFTQSPQTPPKPQGFVQPLPKPFSHTAPPTPPKPQVPPQTLPKPQSFPQSLVKSQSMPLDHIEDFGKHSVHSGDLLSPTESVDQLSDGMSAKQMSIKERWVTADSFRVFLYWFIHVNTCVLFLQVIFIINVNQLITQTNSDFSKFKDCRNIQRFTNLNWVHFLILPETASYSWLAKHKFCLSSRTKRIKFGNRDYVMLGLCVTVFFPPCKTSTRSVRKLGTFPTRLQGNRVFWPKISVKWWNFWFPSSVFFRQGGASSFMQHHSYKCNSKWFTRT